MRSISKVLFGAASLLALAVPAMADDGFSGYVTLATDYRFRGISNSDKSAAAQGSINYTMDGWYGGAWASNVDFNDSTNFELDLYAGKHIDLDGTDLNLEAYYYAYPDAPSGANYSYFEGIVGLSHDFDALSLGVTAAYSPEFFGHTGDAFYVSGSAKYAINDWLSVSTNVGHQWIDLGTDYTHWDFGATATWKSLAFDVRYVDTDTVCFAGPRDWCKGTVVASVTWSYP